METTNIKKSMNKNSFTQYIRIPLMVLTILWMGVIYAFSARNADDSTNQSHRVGRIIGSLVYADFKEWPEQEQLAFAKKVDYPIRKGAHASEYALLGVLVTLTIYGVRRLWLRGLLSLGVSVLYAATDEIHQMFVPGRACQLRDIGIDGLGAAIAIALVLAIIGVHRKKHQHTR